jgi:threonine synthase
MASKEGIFCEPASAASVAGLIKLRKGGLDLSGRCVVCIITGNGLKDPDLAVTSAVTQAIEVEPTMEALENIALVKSI